MNETPKLQGLTFAQLIRLSTAICLANNTWPNDPATEDLVNLVNKELFLKVGLNEPAKTELI